MASDASAMMRSIVILVVLIRVLLHLLGVDLSP
jgi:hypothetical protein